MRCVTGLGNPTGRFSGTRHNIGWAAVDAMCRTYGFGRWTESGHGLVARGIVAGEEVILLKPMTFMNDSGISVAETLRDLDLDTRDLVVVHDDLDLDPGAIRVKTGGGHGGHNGLRSVDAHVGSGYVRVRLGIGRPRGAMPVIDHVLGLFEQDELPWSQALSEAVAEYVPLLLAEKANAFVSAVRTDCGLVLAAALSIARQDARETTCPVVPRGP